MEIICLPVGSLQTNCYLVTDESTRETLIIDPGDEADFISTTLLEKKLIPVGILLTHSHYDHCLGVLELKLNFDIPTYLHHADLFLYQNAQKSATFWSNETRHCEFRYSEPKQSPPLKLPPIDFFITDNQIITFGNSSLQVIHTPGHTPGSVCLLSNCHSGLDEFIPSTISGESSPQSLFTGDTLFASGVGSTDHRYSSKSDLQKSLQKISKLSPTTLIYPGHEDYGFTFTPKES